MIYCLYFDKQNHFELFLYVQVDLFWAVCQISSLAIIDWRCGKALKLLNYEHYFHPEDKTQVRGL